MRFRLCTACLLLVMISASSAQVASHAPTARPETSEKLPTAQMQAAVVNDKPVVRVNGTALTNRDLVREMFAIFPYGQQHDGFPKSMEPEIRKGALDMIIFEELVYQEAQRRKMEIPAARLNQAQADFKKRFANAKQYQEYLKMECQGSTQALRQKIRRSLLIEALLKTEVEAKSAVSLAQAKAYYDKSPKEYAHGESFAIQTISIIPPANPSPDVQKEARKRAEDALRQAKATKSYREFGLLAEKLSDDDWHVNMGDRKTMDAGKLPPPVVEAARKMKPGDISELMQFGTNYTFFRLNEHTLPGRAKFDDVKEELRSNLQKSKLSEIRSEFGKRLRKNAKVEVL
ncbi:MAG TPA: peptidylprolyl isomerase [Terriglobales bacterium]|nr:peptidylprolyl isomerase [Terriglobales bacterium]